MSKVRIYTLAKDLGVDNHKMLEILDGLGVSYKSVSSTIDEENVEIIKQILADEAAEGGDAAPAAASAPAAATAEPEEADETPAAAAQADAEPASDLPHRAPVVTIMGHVDHGKTSLLDYIRKTRVAAKEAGGITQHVGAFEAKTSKGKIVFIDTPGHEAFTTIRARGANVADIAIIVIAADDSLMPQTREAIAHAQAAKVPMLIAINKVDLPQADPEKVKTDLTQLNLVPEEYGGDVIVVPVSAKTGEGVEDLLEYISLTAELEDLRADPKGQFSGVIIEGRVDKQAGVLATVMVQEGTLHVGDFLVVGENYGKIKAMTDSNGGRIKEAGPSTPVQILGFSEVPSSGETVVSAKNEHAAREIVAQRASDRRDEEDARERRKAQRSLADLLGPLGEVHTVNLILRADTQGSLEAIQGILARKETEDVKLNVMLAGIGAPTEGDVLLASTAEAQILCFNVTPSAAVTKVAETKEIPIKAYRIIYEMIDEVDRLIKGNLDPVFEEQYLGRAEVRMVIHHPKSGNIAGSYVTDGMFKRNAKAKVTRGKEVVYEGTVVGLKRFKDDVREVQQGYECGINIDWNDVQEGDIIEASEMVEVEPR
ncbi:MULTISPECIES: translation initiation factor IF-2 [Deinococcus]|jgi:bacterial translation initiation factor 2 (bIF-2)|uniref:Translation initiation factor IF-2 n=1 Tax=Deinococcus radiodurans (strain ATCC 13939 / DSM 20539 / JCM 16871 / CCUG 27074 / LMG 4051 / NBRC 15346 / NCIMB 9279 / VKM B-1422 / R1) TaxID=243230 RepID=IF2_DEIRA|nr:translation initiation factor IF-2 [Deinococcus radiodurans]Q9RTG5.1 RecName: Full=Translation initiation factor IF-2 [Deinococcus radiodurans R1 = ATCC 13939 = DSM 20539]AAF11355.1 initiation factor 2 [Deinococcus radiodurans R1 = ATCC 13939 = DSM 20539]ANC71105.1 translation initiation factor IF-2 [Deinococcus radiodurans R1 = ATCC 13939 = DSM 20539]QEM71216.1 translation initiation factor IF-2 [Deinococcus radiodurans]QIP29758.1 translation initiation factor IF-2 [Deinococcus radiodurans